MDVKEFRTGNLLNYTTSEGDVLTASLDWQDFKWLEEDKKGFELVHDYIPLTEKWLLDFGAENNNDRFNIFRYNIYKPVDYVGYLLCEGNLVLREIEYVHTFQNVIFELTKEELIKK